MRAIMTLAVVSLLGIALPASAQDTVVAQVLQRVCFTATAGLPWEDSTWIAVENNARAMGLTLAAKSDDEYGKVFKYSLRQPAGVYTAEVRSSLGGESCVIDPPDGVSQAQLEQAITQSVGQEWNVAFNPGGPRWTRTVQRQGWAPLSQSIEIPRTSAGAPYVSFSSFPRG